MKRISNSDEKLPNDTSSKEEKQTHAILKFIINQIEDVYNSLEDDDFNLRQVITDILKSIKSNLNNDVINISNEYNLDESEIKNDISSIMNFLDRLSSTFFQSTRQYQFENGELGSGKGVSYSFDGMTDAIRTVTDDYLAIVNHSVDIPATKFESSIKSYFGDYLNQNESKNVDENEDFEVVAGQTYTQKLTTGPLAHVTIIQQKSGPIELCRSFKKLISGASEEGPSYLIDTLVHPYSYLRNILWLSTFRGQWLHGATSNYSNMFDITGYQISNIFGNPYSVDTGVNALNQAGELTGMVLPSIDVEAWEELRYLGSGNKEANDEDDFNRDKMHYHLMDMLLINYIRCKVLAENEHDPKSIIDKIFSGIEPKYGDKYLSEVEKYYPKKLWLNRLKKRIFKAGHLYYPKVSEEESNSGDEKDNPFFEELYRLPQEKLEDNGQFKDDSKKWLEAIESWSDFIAKKYNHSGEDSGE